MEFLDTFISNIFQKDDYDPSKHAAVRFSTLRSFGNGSPM